MAEPVVSFVAETLGNILIQEAKFFSGVSQQVEEMVTQLKYIRSFLKDADRRQDESESVANWVSEVRELAYDVEDVIDTFVVKVAARRKEGLQNAVKRYSCMPKEWYELHKVGSEIDVIKSKIASLTISLQTYGIRSRSEEEIKPTSRLQQLRTTYSHLEEDVVVGLDVDIKNLVLELMGNEEKKCQIVSICGMGGLGKTTLARKVYHQDEIRRHFDAFSWAYISQQCNTRSVLEGILINLTSPSKEGREEISRMKDEEVAKKLYEVQQKNKCLVVLDDIWEVETWRLLKPAFPLGKDSGSKVLLTTRIRNVALHEGPVSSLHEPKCLNEEESWHLFQIKAFLLNHEKPLWMH